MSWNEDTEAALDDFKKQHGYAWPNCIVPDCQYKACIPSDMCYPHTLEIRGIDMRPYDCEDCE